MCLVILLLLGLIFSSSYLGSNLRKITEFSKVFLQKKGEADCFAFDFSCSGPLEEASEVEQSARG